MSQYQMYFYNRTSIRSTSSCRRQSTDTADLKARYQTAQNVFSICLRFSDTQAKRASSVPLNAERAKSQVTIFTWQPRYTVTLVQNVACAESSSHGDLAPLLCRSLQLRMWVASREKGSNWRWVTVGAGVSLK